MLKKINKKLPEIFSFSIWDTSAFLYIMAFAFIICGILQWFGESESYVSMLFILAVFLTSRFTNGYFYGILASFIGVFSVNYVFTYPYFDLNFTLSGYPLTFLSMFSVSIITCTMTTRLLEHEKIMRDIEREKIRANLLRSVSHDLRTPLTTIMGAASAVLENADTLPKETQKELLGGVVDEAKWLVSMVENLLSITKINSETTKLATRDEAAEEIIDEAVRKFKTRFPAMRVKVSIPEDFLIVPMDAILIEQVLINLMENAVFHGKNTTLIDVSLSKLGKNACFLVSDNGSGIPAEYLTHIFEDTAMYRAQPSGDNTKNMGIGLSVCSTIIRSHGGTITAENMPEGGASFLFMLPIKEEYYGDQAENTDS